jgi:uncharacterized protein (TIGR00369 family)
MNEEERDEKLFSAIKEIFDEKIPFNKILGLRVESLQSDRVRVTFEMNSGLIGNYMRGTLHGGVISSVIDVTGGLSAFMGILQKMSGKSLETKLEKFGRLGTIDLRVDYLRPGKGRIFTSTGYNLRIGNRVVVTRIEVHNDAQDLVAVGTGSYVVA